MKMTKCLIIIAFLIILLSYSIVGWRPYRLKKLNVIAYSLSEKIDINATITEDDGVSAYINVKETIQQLFARIELYIDSGNGLFDLQYINQTIDICRFFRDRKYLPLVQLIYSFAVRQGNYPTSCPVKKKLYYGENVKENVEQFPPVIPEKKFYLGLYLFLKEASVLKPLGIYKLYTQIVKI